MDALDLGHLAMVLALACLAATSAIGPRRAPMARRLVVAGAVAASVAVAVLARVLVRRDYRLTYVSEVVARSASRPYRLAGLWAAMAGSLLLYAAMAAVAVAVGSVGVARRHARLLGGYLRAGSLVAAWLLGVSLLAADPFRRLAQPAIDGVGLTPILEHPAMLVHPPLLYAGALATLPLAALALAARWTRAVDGGVAATLVRWSLVGLVLSTAALALGARWAYVEVGWGGFWAWDPVENGGLLAWLALLTVVHVGRRPTLAVGAALAAFGAAMLGAVVTRSGAATSVHAFGEATRVGYGLSALAAVIVAVVVTTLWWTRRGLDADTPTQAAPIDGTPLAGQLTLVHVVLVAVTGTVVLVGTLWPIVGRWFDGRRRAVDARFFTAAVTPLAVLAAVGSTVAVLRLARPRAYLAGATRWSLIAGHLGLVLLVASSIASSFGADRTVVLAPGGSTRVAGVTLTAGRAEALPRDRYRLVVLPLQVRGRGATVTLRPGLRVYETAGAVLPETARRAGWLLDTQVALRRFDPSGVVVFDVHVRPFIRWVWIAALVMLAAFLGAFVSSSRNRGRLSVCTPE